MSIANWYVLMVVMALGNCWSSYLWVLSQVVAIKRGCRSVYCSNMGNRSRGVPKYRGRKLRFYMVYVHVTLKRVRPVRSPRNKASWPELSIVMYLRSADVRLRASSSCSSWAMRAASAEEDGGVGWVGGGGV